MAADMRVTRVRTYPVKSFAGNDVESAGVEPWGLAGDRRWALIDERGQNVTARMLHHLLGLRAEPSSSGVIRIFDRGGESISVAPPIDAATTRVGFSGLAHATPVDALANSWLSERIGREVRLVWQQDPSQRPIAESDGGLPGEAVSFADAAPLLLVTEASMRQLNAWIGADEPPLDIVRFRPNIVVDGLGPFDEDHWQLLRIGEVTFRKTENCDRCVMTMVDPDSLLTGKEPIRTLARHRRWDRKTWFGIRLTPVGVGVEEAPSVSIGDRVEILG